MKVTKASSEDDHLHIRRRANFGIVGFLILCAFFTGCEDATPPPPQIEAVQTAINRSAEYLEKNTKDDGMFQYRINMNPAIVVPERYNILRHAGTIYAMSMYYQLQPDADMKSAIERAGRYLRDEATDLVSGNDYMLAVWSEPDVNRSGQPPQAKLGGTGLGLVALLSLENIHPGFTPLPDLQALGQFTVYMQKEDGSFYSKYIPSIGGVRVCGSHYFTRVKLHWDCLCFTKRTPRIFGSNRLPGR